MVASCLLESELITSYSLQSARNAYHAECLGSESFPPETKAADNLDMAITRTEEINKGIFVDSPAALSDSWNTNTDCTHMCNCQCHRLGRFCTPRILRSIVGSIFIDYSGIPILNPKCNNAGCANAKDRSSLRVSYYFPRWLLSRMVSAVMSYNLRDGPELSHLRTPRVRPPNAEVFVVAREGDVERMRQLLTERSASPFDIDVNGYSALFVSHPSLKSPAAAVNKVIRLL